ncbi:alpha/beta hydrolase [Sciscionella marina]|uniref:alpha/beta hydrolase n=1 Tax=Sciscionella marina TaxID=508770 RepID=UPI000374D122|nr:alpha/beta hydrolase [Sciscionella marina]
MQVGLNRLIDEELTAFVEESKQFNAAAKPAGDEQPQPDPATTHGLWRARGKPSVSAAESGSTALERLVQAGGRQTPVRITLPETNEISGAYLDLHGGGFYLGSAIGGDTRNAHDARHARNARNARLAEATGAVVVSVDYRLAPEDPWPAAPDDCETAARWLIEQAESLFGTDKLAIGGASAGANLAMSTLLRLRDRDLAESFAGAALQFGAYDLSGQSPSGRLFADEFFIQAYAGHVADRTDPDISPLYGDLNALPPTLLVVGSSDFLLEDNLAMTARLCAAGNDVDLRVYPESVHGFTSFPTAMAATAMRGIEHWLADRLVDKELAPPAVGLSPGD